MLPCFNWQFDFTHIVYVSISTAYINLPFHFDIKLEKYQIKIHKTEINSTSSNVQNLS